VLPCYRFFDGGGDGDAPTAGLVNVNGTLYGTTHYGGESGSGAPYDGALPNASLIDVNGTLYGTTTSGGTHDCGTVYSITTSVAENVLHAFACGKDGDAPIGLIDVNGTLYGAAFDRGSGCKPQGCGLVYSLGTDGSGEDAALFSRRLRSSRLCKRGVVRHDGSRRKLPRRRMLHFGLRNCI